MSFRFGRCEESFGEDPTIISKMGVAQVLKLNSNITLQNLFVLLTKSFDFYLASNSQDIKSIIRVFAQNMQQLTGLSGPGGPGAASTYISDPDRHIATEGNYSNYC